MLATDGDKYEALNNDLLNTAINLKTRQPQGHCAHIEKTSFGRSLLDLPKLQKFSYSWGQTKL
jgi:hypothetical protein